ncbi:hypothetical protein FIBSPDRAFT_959178 [Athelia psychrophila]|uniref:Uncharacterized protein n=1 Tax=Athelia psychrophila TaxID=1759441 RepID=A0A166DT89_9AGAM|nr:hypothetical protein FIBSPDRAFT_959178 [Fibularhizoctonia sp. CBS 109695]
MNITTDPRVLSTPLSNFSTGIQLVSNWDLLCVAYDLVSRFMTSRPTGYPHYGHYIVELSNLRNVKIRFRARMLFPHNVHLVSPAVAHAEVLKSHKWLDTFQTHSTATRSYSVYPQDTTESYVPNREKRDGKTASAKSFF